MTTTRTRSMTALIAVAGVLGMLAPVHAATPTQADFDACNREAQAQVTMPSASPSGSPTSGSSSMPSGTSGATPGSGVSSGPGTTTPGASGSTGPSGSMGSVSGGTGSTSSGDLPGIASTGANDPAYQQAYRDCLHRRGF